MFLRSADPERLARWYAEHLGMKIGADKSCVLMWTDEEPAGTGMTVWTVFPEDTTYFGTGPQPAMVNYRVDDLDVYWSNLWRMESGLIRSGKTMSTVALPGSGTAMATG